MVMVKTVIPLTASCLAACGAPPSGSRPLTEEENAQVEQILDQAEVQQGLTEGLFLAAEGVRVSLADNSELNTPQELAESSAQLVGIAREVYEAGHIYMLPEQYYPNKDAFAYARKPTAENPDERIIVYIEQDDS